MADLLPFTSNAALDLRAQEQQQQQQQAFALQATPLISSLASHVRRCWDEAVQERQSTVESRLLNALRMRKGEYPAEKLAEIRKYSGSEVYMRIVANKCRVGAGWLKDAYLGQTDRPWVLKPTPRPSLQTDAEQQARQWVQQQLQQQQVALAQDPMSPTAQAPLPTSEGLAQMVAAAQEHIAKQLRKEAALSAERMEQLIHDQLVEGRFYEAFEAFIDDLVTFPAAILKGPILRKKKVMEWRPSPLAPSSPAFPGEETDASVETLSESPESSGVSAPLTSSTLAAYPAPSVASPLSPIAPPPPVLQPQFVEETVLCFERVSPFDFYPAPGIEDVDGGYVIQRHRLSRSDLNSLIGVETYNADAIREVLKAGDTGQLLFWLDGARMALEEKSSLLVTKTQDSFDALEYWGSVSGKQLREWGLSEEEIPEETLEYPACVWLIGSWVIKATLNYYPLATKPYYKESYERLPGMFWGHGIPDLIADIQDVCNAAARSLINNMAIASGPQVAINVDRVPPEEKPTAMYPWKLWLVRDNPMGTTSPPIDFFQPASNAAEIMGVYEKFAALADDYSGIPKYWGGSQDVGTLGRTASGMSMVMGAATKTLRQVVSGIDQHILSRVLETMYSYNMMYSQDKSVKGDAEVYVRGASALVMKDSLQLRRNEFLQATANPIDSQIVGVEGRAALLRETAKDLELDVDDIVPPLEVLQQRQQQQMMMAQQAQAPAQQNQQLTDGSAPTDNFSPNRMRS